MFVLKFLENLFTNVVRVLSFFYHTVKIRQYEVIQITDTHWCETFFSSN